MVLAYQTGLVSGFGWLGWVCSGDCSASEGEWVGGWGSRPGCPYIVFQRVSHSWGGSCLAPCEPRQFWLESRLDLLLLWVITLSRQGWWWGQRDRLLPKYITFLKQLPPVTSRPNMYRVPAASPRPMSLWISTFIIKSFFSPIHYLNN